MRLWHWRLKLWGAWTQHYQCTHAAPVAEAKLYMHSPERQRVHSVLKPRNLRRRVLSSQPGFQNASTSAHSCCKEKEMAHKERNRAKIFGHQVVFCR